MASYSTITAAIALGIDRKRLENLLLRCRIPGTTRGRQGRARRLSRSSLLALAALVRLQDELGIPASHAAELLAGGLLPAASGAGGRHADAGAGVELGAPGPAVRRGPFTLIADVAALERDLATALAEAIEVSPRPRRGRPPGTGPASHG